MKTILITIAILAVSYTTGSAQVGKTSSALLGDITYADGCSPEQQAFNDKIMMFGRIVATTDAFEQCVREKLSNLYRKCNGDPFYNASLETQIQKVIEVARSPNNLHVKCKGFTHGNARAGLGEYGITEREVFRWGDWLNQVNEQFGKRICNEARGEKPQTNNCRFAPYPWPYSQAAGIAWHEVMHQHGYTHGANDQKNALKKCGYEGDTTWHYQVNTMPYLIGSCITDIIDQSAAAGDIDACSGSNQLNIVTAYNGNRLRCVNDPGNSGIGIIKVSGGKLLDEAIKPWNDWIGEWRLGATNNLVATGDFNGDGKDDFVVTSEWGIGLLTYDGSIWKPLVVKRSGTRFGGWLFKSQSDVISGVGDFNGDGKDDLLITSSWGIGILTFYGSSLTSIMLKPNNSWLGAWRYNGSGNASKDVIQGIGDLDGDSKDEIIVTSDWGIGILELRSSSLVAILAKPTGSGFGGWNFQSTHEIKGVGDFNGDRKEDFVITSDWGIGILTLQRSNLTSLMLKPNNTWFGGWRYNGSGNRGKDVIQSVGDFDGDNRDEILVTSSWGIGLLELRSNSLYALVAQPNGTRFGSWSFNSADANFHGVGDFNGDRKEDLVLTSRWGLGILTNAGSSFTTITLQPNNRLLGSWLLNRSDQVVAVGNYAGEGNSKFLIKKSN